ncbi:MAG: hypothetical protein IKF78_10655 [Atopobiaceae bacterium]|nr:hypothetical protein [Atopobiaceae bacterium]
MAYQEQTVESIREKAIATDVAADGGFFQLRNMLAVLVSLDGRWIKGVGKSNDRKRLLPPLSTIKAINGVSVNALVDLDGYGKGRVTSGRADTYFLIRELGRALADGEACFEYVGGEDTLVIKRYMHRLGLGQLDLSAEDYIAARSPNSDSSWIVTLDVCFTAVGLREFVITVCDSYLGSR